MSEIIHSILLWFKYVLSIFSFHYIELIIIDKNVFLSMDMCDNKLIQTCFPFLKYVSSIKTST